MQMGQSIIYPRDPLSLAALAPSLPLALAGFGPPIGMLGAIDAAVISTAPLATMRPLRGMLATFRAAIF